MALSAYTIFEARGGSGSDTACSGAFDPSQTAGMNTDGAATSATGTAPVFSSASYNFVSGDVGAYVYIAAGTNWIPGWYEIASVAANAATLNATSGEVALGGNYIQKVSSSNGCATTASPTGATWTIDYSQQSSAQFSYTDLVIGATTTNLTSASKAFGKQQVGNIIQVTSGSGFTTGFYCILSVSTVTATMDRSVGTAASTAGHGYQGGAAATISANLLKSSGVAIMGNIVWMTGTLTITASVVIPIGTSASGSRIAIYGYGTYRGDGTKAEISCSTNSVNCFNLSGNISGTHLRWLNMACTAGTPGNCIEAATGSNSALLVTIEDCTINAWEIGIDTYDGETIQTLWVIETTISNCKSYNCKLSFPAIFKGCYILDSANDGIILTPQSTNDAGMISFQKCVFAGNAGQGLNSDSGAYYQGLDIDGCAFYDNSDAGLNLASESGTQGVQSLSVTNSIFYGNGTYGINLNTTGVGSAIPNVCIQRNNAFGANVTAARSSGAPIGVGDITLSGNPFNNPSSGDFSLNTTAGAGAACTGAGWQSSIL